MKPVAIVDYGVSNIDSVVRAVEESGARPFVASQPSDLRHAAAIVLPGVGAFSKGMENLHALGFVDELQERVIGSGIPFLGLCLGMHLIATRGSEGGDTAGLGWIDGDIVRLEPVDPRERVPHVGWNDVVVRRPSAILPDREAVRDYYFVHSYRFRPVDESDVVATTAYCGGFASVVARDNVYGVQFHPEKSSRAGFALFRNFLAL